MDRPRDLSAAIAHANEIRERERIRTIGWAALAVGVFCWCLGGMLGFMFIQFGAGGDFVYFAACFGLVASGGCLLAVISLRMSAEKFRHSLLALALNELFLIIALTYVVRCL
jgi:hypothetical protein